MSQDKNISIQKTSDMKTENQSKLRQVHLYFKFKFLRVKYIKNSKCIHSLT